MNDDASHAIAASRVGPRETVSGDRVCMQCLHPLAGSAIVREPETGLLYCRCVECGTAAALLEYPTIAPWVRRMKSVAVAVFMTAAAIAILAGIGLGVLMPTVASNACGEQTGPAVVEIYRSSGGSTKDANQNFDSGRWAVADQEWLASDAGIAALRAARRSPNAVIPFLGLAILGGTLIVPIALLLGLAGMRRHPIVRAAAAALLPTIGGALVTAGATALPGLMAGTPRNISWSQYCLIANGPFFAALMVGWLALVAAVLAATAPHLAAAIFRFILPPRDRRLVAWIWEWRGKPIPKD